MLETDAELLTGSGAVSLPTCRQSKGRSPGGSATMQSLRLMPVFQVPCETAARGEVSVPDPVTAVSPLVDVRPW